MFLGNDFRPPNIAAVKVNSQNALLYAQNKLIGVSLER
jgi:hypothetical protein